MLLQPNQGKVQNHKLRSHLTAIELRSVRKVCISSTSRDDQMTETQSPRGNHQKTKSTAVGDYNKYKIYVDTSAQFMSYYWFPRNSLKF